jgi:hypothetical protein
MPPVFTDAKRPAVIGKSKVRRSKSPAAEIVVSSDRGIANAGVSKPVFSKNSRQGFKRPKDLLLVERPKLDCETIDRS